MLIRFISPCRIGRFGESLASDSKIRIKCVFLNNQPSEARPAMAFGKSI